MRPLFQLVCAMRWRLIPSVVAFAISAVLVLPAAAQSVTSGSLTGTVRTSDGRPVHQALITLNAIGAGSAQSGSTTPSGSFSISLVSPGSYELRVEALGYRPLLARGLTISGGETRRVDLVLSAAPPPVLTVDTITLAGAASSRWRSGGIQFGGNEINAVPHRTEDLASVVSLSTAFDESLGAQGLPGEMTLIVADGIPFYRAPHPTARSEMVSGGLFPRSALSGVTAQHHGSDIEWAGAAGGYVGLATRSATLGGGLELDGAYAGRPTWSSSELNIEKPTLLSYQGGVRGTVPFGSSARLVLSGDALSQQTPLMPRINETLATQFIGLDPALVTSLADPGVETYNRYSGLARFDLQQSRTNSFFFRGAGSFVTRDFDNAGPVSLAGAAAPEEESVDFSTALGVVSEYSRTLMMEFRAGFSGSYREFGPSIAGVPPAYLVGSGSVLGDLPSAAGKSSRTDVVINPVVRYTPDAGTLKFGATIRASSHTYAHSRASLGDYFYADAASLQTGQGFGQTTSAPEESFGTREFGVFAQFETALSPALQFSIGGRYDYEVIGGDGGTLNTDWFDATGLSTLNATGLSSNDYRDAFHQFGARSSLIWEPKAGGATRVLLTASLHEGDVDTRSLYQAFAEDTEGTSTRFAGSGINWPDGGIPPLASPDMPSMTLLGPDTRAPLTTNFSLGLVQRLAPSTSLFARGSMRRTDFLSRRRNLNVPIVPQALDPNGRWIYGSLAQDGAMVSTTSDDARRFAGFGEVWAIDPDGWSEYVGLTAGFEHVSAVVDLYASYTYSETTDNWVGAASGSVGSALDPGVPAEIEGSPPWSEGVSDFDVPHRAAAAALFRFGAVSVTGAYRFRSGIPFTPGYRLGVDANGDGSSRNDVAFVPDAAALATVVDAQSCLDSQSAAFAVRNSCRGPEQHSVDVRIQFRLGAIGGRPASITLDAFNLVESQAGVIDDALLLVDPAGSIATSPDGSTITVPFVVNPGFGSVLYPSSRGRMLRVGVRIGG